MIVTCSGCHTRFRVPDDKVGPNGARLRCSRCGELFAAPPPAAATEAPSAPPRDDSFTGPRDDPFARAGLAALGVPAANPAQAAADALALEEPPPRPAAPPVRFDDPPPRADLLDFGACDFAEAAAAPASPPAAAPEPPPPPGPVAVAPPEAAPAPAPPPVVPAVRAAEPRSRRAGPIAVDALSLAALVTVAAALLGWWGPSRGGASPLAPDVPARGTLYDTAAGRPVLVVRGVLPAAAPTLPLAVELLDGDEVVRRARATPGAAPEPEEVWAIDGAPSAERLAAALAARARRAPGAEAPFGAVFADLPADPGRLSVRVVPVHR